jgi:GrpB-like predicted nucleotidyltransferase (UPF0157 family)
MSVRIIEVVPYDEAWPSTFVTEKQSLSDMLGECVLAIHHIGSTAVPGLPAKPIIDILLEVSDLFVFDIRSPLLAGLGYQAKGEFGIPGRRYFTKGGERRTHQLHAFKRSDTNVTRHLAFRDYLRTHPEIAVEYADLKRRVAASCENDIERYSAGKHDFVEAHQAAALVWRSTVA